MKYAIVEGQRREALPRLLGTCPVCEVGMRPRCGRFRVAHWAHPPGIVDHRWEPETEWHRNWKGCFPVECQEIVHRASNGERHIADVKTAHGQVIEFQNSPISEDERCSREAFYQPMYWVVNGQKQKGDRRQFYESLRRRKVLNANPLTVVVPVEKCMLLQKWADSRVLVFFDFGEIEEASDVFRFGAPVLWARDPRSPKGKAVLTPVYRKIFLESMTKGEPLKGINFSKAFGQPLRLSVPQVILSLPHPRRPEPPRPKPPRPKRYSRRRRRPWSRSRRGHGFRKP